jgi:tetratricopeptide (TPR) repeat protein
MKGKLKIMGIMLGLLVVFNFPLLAEDFLIDYLEGELEKKEGSKWVELFEADTVESNAIIRLKDDSMVELSGDDLNITLIRPGTYNLEQITKDSRKSDSYGLDDIVSSKFAALSKDLKDEKTEGGVMGVRAAKIEDEVDFIGDEIIENLFIISKQKMSDGDYEGAISLLNDALDWGTDENESILLYYIGFCYSNLGFEALAISYLMDVDIDSDMPFYADYVFLFGSLLMKSYAHEDALALFLDYLDKSTKDDSFEYQTIHYLTALCYIQLDNSKEAEKFLKMTKQINQNTDTGKKAASLLRNL